MEREREEQEGNDKINKGAKKKTCFGEFLIIENSFFFLRKKQIEGMSES